MATLMIISCIVIALVSALLIGIILIQQSKGGGFGIAFGGIGESVFGAHAASHLIKITVTLMIVFFVIILLAAFITSTRTGETSIGDELLNAPDAPTASIVAVDTATNLPVSVDTPAK